MIHLKNKQSFFNIVTSQLGFKIYQTNCTFLSIKLQLLSPGVVSRAHHQYLWHHRMATLCLPRTSGYQVDPVLLRTQDILWAHCEPRPRTAACSEIQARVGPENPHTSVRHWSSGNGWQWELAKLSPHPLVSWVIHRCGQGP